MMMYKLIDIASGTPIIKIVFIYKIEKKYLLSNFKKCGILYEIKKRPNLFSLFK